MLQQMRIISLHILKWGEQNSFFLCSAYDLSFLSWYQRSFFKETVNFGARTSANRTKMGQAQAILLPDAQAKCYVVVDKSGLAYVALADDQYPQRIAFLILRKMSAQFQAVNDPRKFDALDKDISVEWVKLEEQIKRFQDPKEVDKLEKLKNQLKEVQQICHKNLNELLKRGQDLDKLMEKSKDVSNLSMDFYRTAKKTNSRCCSLY